MGNNHVSKLYTETYSTCQMSPPMKLEELIDKYGRVLPLMINITKMKKKCKNTVVDEGQFLYAHFKKESDIVSVQTDNGASYAVPVRSSFQCSCLYSPQGKKATTTNNGSLAEYTFNGINELLNANPMPQMVSATQGYISFTGHEEACIDSGQILKLQELETDSRSGKRSIRCIDVYTYEQKIIEDNCNVVFTTDPACIQMPFNSLMEHVCLPCQAIFFSTEEASNEGFPNKIPCVITDKKPIVSVIASPHEDLSTDTLPNRIIELLPSSSIRVSVVSLQRVELNNLTKKTAGLLQTFSPSSLIEVVGDLSTPIDAIIQTTLFKYIEDDIYWSKEFVNKEILNQVIGTNNEIKTLPAMPPLSNTPPQEKEDEEDGEELIYDEVLPPPLPSPSPPLSLPVTPLKKSTSVDSPPILPKPQRAGSFTVYKDNYNQIQTPTVTIPTVNNNNKMADVNPVYTAPPSTSLKSNQEILTSYDVNQVLEMLDKFNMTQYKDVFKQEQITGSLLLDLDDDILENELGVTKRIHRLKILRIINGQQPLM
jgi:hypothetical protein